MDGEFAALDLLHALRPSMAVITRMRKDARLFDPPSNEDKRGRPARKGARQPLLSTRITDPATRWLRVVQSSRTSWHSAGWIEYTHGTALWHHGGKPIVPILWVLVRYPDGRRGPEAFLCTDTSADPRDVLDCFNRRWAVETTYEEARAHLGMETQRQWSDPAIFRTTPVLLGLYSVVTRLGHLQSRRVLQQPGGECAEGSRPRLSQRGAGTRRPETVKPRADIPEPRPAPGRHHLRALPRHLMSRGEKTVPVRLRVRKSFCPFSRAGARVGGQIRRGRSGFGHRWRIHG